jgi:hypothetical protein
MKQFILFFTVIFFFASCKKDPTLAEQSIGNYTLSSVKLNKDVVPGMTGKIIITERTESTVDVSITLTIQGKSETVDVENLDLADSSGDIDISQGTDLVGTISGKTILFYLDDAPDLWVLNGSRK